MNKLLLLLLGCAVQGEEKEIFIKRITRMEQSLQKAIVGEIQKITEGTEVVVVSALEVGGDIACGMERLVEMDEYSHEHTESDECSSTTGGASLNGDALPVRMARLNEDRRNRSPSPSNYRHLNVEIAALKSECRKLRNERDEKEYEIIDLKDQLEHKSNEVLEKENKYLAIYKDACKIREYRDEIDALQQRNEKLAKCEQENKVLREKLSVLDECKERMEALKKENEELEGEVREAKTRLDANRVRARSQMESEGRMNEMERQVKDLQSEITQKNAEMEGLLTEVARLEMLLSQQSAKTTELERMAENNSFIARESLGGNSLLDEMNDSRMSEMADLRSQNSFLKARLDAIEAEESDDWTTWKERAERAEKCLEDMHEEERLKERQLNELEITLSDRSQQLKKLRDDFDDMREERDECIRSLQEARRNFLNFQADFSNKLEDETRAKIRELEEEKERLATESVGAKEQLEEIEKQLWKRKKDEEEWRHRYDQLEEEKAQLLRELDIATRAKKSGEGERNALKEKLSALEDELEDVRVRLIEGGDWKRRAETAERNLVEKSSKLGDIEAECRQLKQQMEMEMAKTQRLREDLVGEKTKNGEMIGRLRGICNSIALHGGKIDEDMDDVKMIECIDDVIMDALNAARREADSLRLQQHKQIAELSDLKKDIEKLRRSENASLIEVDDKVRELSEENRAIKEQVFVLQEKNREQQIELAARASEISSARRQMEQMSKQTVQSIQTNSELARLQVSLRNLQLQEDLLKKDNVELRRQVEVAEKARQEALRATETLNAMHKALLNDHDRLQNLHDLLSQDYERSKNEVHEVRQKLRSIKPPISYAEYESMRTCLQSEKESREHREKNLLDLRGDLDKLRKEKDTLARNCEQLNGELRRLRSVEMTEKSSSSVVRHQLETLSRDVSMKEVEMAEMRKEIELMAQLNRQLKEDMRELFRQNEVLLKDNRELHSRLLTDKDTRQQERDEYKEHVTALHRQRERLENKIMDQYKNSDSVRVKNKQPTFVKRTVKALIPKKSRSIDKPCGSTGSTTEESSTYSADESPLPHSSSLPFDEPTLQPTSSSSEETDRLSPRYQSAQRSSKSVPPSVHGIRDRNGLIGGSVRVHSVSPPKRIVSGDIDAYSVYEERSSRVFSSSPCPSSLPPRAPVRGSSISSSMRLRPPPPPYRSRPPPPTYAPRTSTPLSNGHISELRMDASPINGDRVVVKEGEKREFIREKEERDEKAMSIYENVNGKTNESTVWYEYGCV